MSTSSQTVTVNTEKVKIFDTTLRDGEQSPGCSMNLEEKLKVAAVLEELNVDIIEAGFPIASNGDFEAVAAIAKQAQKATIAGLARASKKDIDRAWEAVKHAKSSRIHTFLSTSPLHMKFKLQKEPDVVHQMVVDSVTHARNLCDDVEWSAEDGSRTEHEFLCRCVESAIKAGATTINIPDTVGYAVPEEYAALIEMLFNKVPNIDKQRSLCIVTTIWAWPLPIRWPLLKLVHARSNARLTVSASAPVTLHWKKSSWRCKSAVM